MLRYLHSIYAMPKLLSCTLEVEAIEAGTILVSKRDLARLGCPYAGIDFLQDLLLFVGYVVFMREAIDERERGHDGVAGDVDQFSNILVTLPILHLLPTKACANRFESSPIGTTRQ